MSIHVRPLVAWQLGGYLSRVCECVASHTRTSQIFHKHKVLSQSADLRVGVFETCDLLGVCEALCVGGTVGESVLVRHDPIVWQMYCV